MLATAAMMTIYGTEVKRCVGQNSNSTIMVQNRDHISFRTQHRCEQEFDNKVHIAATCYVCHLRNELPTADMHVMQKRFCGLTNTTMAGQSELALVNADKHIPCKFLLGIRQAR